MPPDELKVAIIVATTGNGHLFVAYLFIYLLQKTRFGSLRFKFLEFQQLRNKYVKYSLRGTFIVVTQWLGPYMFHHKSCESSILTNIYI
jgi:hypothetical protein